MNRRLPQRIVTGGQSGVDRAALEVALRLGLNVWDSDGTLVLNRGELAGGTLYTVRIAERIGRPLRVVDLDRLADPLERAGALAEVRQWIEEEGLATLNVAGPRESKSPGIGAAAAAFLESLLGA
jgi:hypothetical protein